MDDHQEINPAMPFARRNSLDELKVFFGTTSKNWGKPVASCEKNAAVATWTLVATSYYNNEAYNGRLHQTLSTPVNL